VLLYFSGSRPKSLEADMRCWINYLFVAIECS
jgi:hypothetical protein